MQYYSIAVVFRLILTKSFGVGVSCGILYSCVVYLYVSSSRSITMVGGFMACANNTQEDKPAGIHLLEIGFLYMH